jgi:hypothetical protein
VPGAEQPQQRNRSPSLEGVMGDALSDQGFAEDDLKKQAAAIHG